MAQNLPDEVLKEILSLSTHIPDEEFSFNDDPNPFGQNPRHFSLLLLVCKRWLRVATPLLYGVVVIRSTAQAQSLADAVQANKSFGSFIKKMRLEGGFGQSPRTFLSLAPNISDLFITLDIWTNDSVSGLCSALQQIEPCRLIISQRHSIKNAKARKLRDALYAAVAHWKHLDTVEYYNELWIMMDDDDDYEDDSTDEYRKFTEALTSRKSLTLKNLILPDCTPRFMAAISQITTLESVRILHGTETENMKTFLMNHPKLATIVHYPSHTRVNPHAPITSSLLRTEPSSNAKPFRGAPATMSDTLWGLIFSYATSFYEPLSNGHNIPMEKKRRVATAISISSVCRSFHEIMQPRLYRIVLIRNPKSLKLFSELVSVNKDVGPLVRKLSVAMSSEQLETKCCSDQFQSVLKHLTALEVYSGRPHISFTCLQCLCRLSGATLRGIFVNLRRENVGQAKLFDLGQLPSLTSLHCSLQVEKKPKKIFEYITLDAPKLQNLEYGQQDSEAHPSISLFSHARLTALKHLALNGTSHGTMSEFLRLNGGQVVELKLNLPPAIEALALCPQLERLHIISPYPRNLDHIFKQGPGHPQLCKLIINVPCTGMTQPDRGMQLVIESLLNFDFSSFPNFREIHVENFVWPTTDRDVQRHPTCISFCRSAKQQGIVVFDGTGTPWRERAQLRRDR